MSSKIALGIDLGTSNSALAHVQGEASPAMLEIEQAFGPDTCGKRRSLPSALYLPNKDEFPKGSFKLPWTQGDSAKVVGQFAREHGAQVPDRLITSAKSWLCNPHVDRRSGLLPWKSESKADKLSPLEASQHYLEHLMAAWKQTQEGEASPESIVLTIPASFDEVARKLTLEAAEVAKLENITLLEEPQAAFYAWIERTGTAWREQVKAGDVVLVCDVGGGTADFSLIAVSEAEGDLTLERISVGDHILLGGDNVDLALALVTRQKLAAEGTEIDDWQFQALVHGARSAKEALFSDEKLEEVAIAIPSRGSGLFAGTVSTKLERSLLHQIALEGFLPRSPVTEHPQSSRSGGLQEFGLAYEADPVLSKHLAHFLCKSLESIKGNEALADQLKDSPALKSNFLRPDAILFNGGFFQAGVLRERVLELLKQWSDGKAVHELQGADLDLAVARGAAHYGASKLSGKGVRIKAGAARSYYIGLESSMPAVPGFTPPVKALCVVPQGMEEGSEEVLGEKEFGLVTGQKARFRFFSSNSRAGDGMGAVLNDAEKELEETAALESEMDVPEDMQAGEIVPVHLHSKVTETGTLELWMQHARSERKWKLEYEVRTQ